MIFFQLTTFGFLIRFIFCSESSKHTEAVSDVPVVEAENQRAIYSYTNSCFLSWGDQADSEFHLKRLNGYNIPVDSSSGRFHSVSDRSLMEEYVKTNVMSFYVSAISDPLIYYERPSSILFFYQLQDKCANFCSSKSSMDPSAFSKEEKIRFIDEIHDLGVFTEFNNSTKSTSKKSEEASSRMNAKVAHSTVVINDYHCREALRIVASHLSRSQIEWLLRNASSSVLNNPGLLDSLSDFSMFTPADIAKTYPVNRYDWLKNANALRTLSPSALILVFSFYGYNLTFEQLELLNANRPIEELFKAPIFKENPFVWQIAFGSPFQRDEYLNIENIEKAILSVENSSEHTKYIMDMIFSFYFYSEMSISLHISAIHRLILNSSGVEAISDALSFYTYALNNVLNHRSIIFNALNSKFSSSADFKSILRLFVTPFHYKNRRAISVYSEVKREFSETPTWNELFDLVTEASKCDPSEFKYYRTNSLILALTELICLPTGRYIYRVPEEEELTLSSLDMVKSMASYFKARSWKAQSLFLIQSALDFNLSKDIQIGDHGSSVENSSEFILNNYLALYAFNSEADVSARETFPEHYDSFVLSCKTSKANELKSKYDRFCNLFQNYYQEQLKFIERGKREKKISLEEFLHINEYESRMHALTQNLFKIEMIENLMANPERLEIFGEYAFMLSHSQVIGILGNESGKLLLSTSRKFVHNLPTYEDFNASHIREFRLQAQYASKIRTLPILPLLVSLKSDNYLFNDPCAVAIRLITDSRNRYESQAQLLLNLWKFVPFQAFANLINHGTKGTNYITSSTMIQNYLLHSKEVSGKGLESCRAILQWLIMSEIRALEAFVLINTQEHPYKWKGALEMALILNNAEQVSRIRVIEQSLPIYATNTDVIEKLRPNFVNDFLEVIGGPLAPVRGGMFLTANGLMDKNVRFIHFGTTLSGFQPWVTRTREMVPIECVSSGSAGGSELSPELVEGVSEKTVDVSSTDNEISVEHINAKTLIQTNLGKISFSDGSCNILQFRDYIEEDCKSRRDLVFRMLQELESALGVTGGSSLQVWKDRLDLLGFMSADGFTVSPSFNLDSSLNLILHESILFHKLKTMAGMFFDSDNIPRKFKPDFLNTLTVKASIPQSVSAVPQTSAKVSKKAKKPKN